MLFYIKFCRYRVRGAFLLSFYNQRQALLKQQAKIKSNHKLRIRGLSLRPNLAYVYVTKYYYLANFSFISSKSLSISTLDFWVKLLTTIIDISDKENPGIISYR